MSHVTLQYVFRPTPGADSPSLIALINHDPAFQAWRVKSVKSNLASWVRSNQTYEIPL